MNKEKLKKKNGITLIALVITIIVMLILAAVTITVAVNGGLFNYAGKAVGDTNREITAEQNLSEGQVTIGEQTYNSIDEYLKGDTISFTIDGEMFTTKIGDTWEDFALNCELKLYTATYGKNHGVPYSFGIIGNSLGDASNAAPRTLYLMCLDGSPVKYTDVVLDGVDYLAVGSGVTGVTYTNFHMQ